ncbi:MAG: NUDIX domain-containing protein [Candidatus Omnitrophota bacterium]|jgi:mutator protein MutT|nr:MAG: NUDIX domain-containing protein [Candidatus Omnitrophota bacterium]
MENYVKEIRKLVGNARIFLPGVRALILNEKGQVLLQKRTDMNIWGLPAGAVEIGETAMETLHREVREETSLQVLSAEPMALYSGKNQQFSYPNGDQIQPFALAFIVREWEGEPEVDGVEGCEVRWFGLEALPGDIVPVHRQVLDDYVNRYEGKFFLGE